MRIAAANLAGIWPVEMLLGYAPLTEISRQVRECPTGDIECLIGLEVAAWQHRWMVYCLLEFAQVSYHLHIAGCRRVRMLCACKRCAWCRRTSASQIGTSLLATMGCHELLTGDLIEVQIPSSRVQSRAGKLSSAPLIEDCMSSGRQRRGKEGVLRSLRLLILTRRGPARRFRWLTRLGQTRKA
jgi:hypothetical protein